MTEKSLILTNRLINSFYLDDINVARDVVSAIKFAGRATTEHPVKPDLDKVGTSYYMTDWNLTLDPIHPSFEIFYNFLEESLKTSITNLLAPAPFPPSPYGFKIKNMWGSIYKKGDLVPLHSHFASSFSFCYYASASNKSAPLVIESLDLHIQPETGLLVIFCRLARPQCTDSKGRRRAYCFGG